MYISHRGAGVSFRQSQALSANELLSVDLYLPYKHESYQSFHLTLTLSNKVDTQDCFICFTIWFDFTLPAVLH